MQGGYEHDKEYELNKKIDRLAFVVACIAKFKISLARKSVLNFDAQ